GRWCRADGQGVAARRSPRLHGSAAARDGARVQTGRQGPLPRPRGSSVPAAVGTRGPSPSPYRGSSLGMPGRIAAHGAVEKPGAAFFGGGVVLEGAARGAEDAGVAGALLDAAGVRAAVRAGEAHQAG